MTTPEDSDVPATGQFLVYQAEDGRTKIDVRVEGETVWLTQLHMAELFQVGVPTINYHLKEVFDSGELQPEATIRKFRIVRREGSRDVARSIDFYNLDAIISVGYRVKSAVATRFRICATQQLREYIVKGFVLDDERLRDQYKLDAAHLALGRLDSVTTLLPDTHVFLYTYVRKEAVLSSQIEGTQSSLSDLLLFEANESPGVPLDDVIDVSNYVAAAEHGLTRIRSGFRFQTG